jgi:hypothetical protein
MGWYGGRRLGFRCFGRLRRKEEKFRASTPFIASPTGAGSQLRRRRPRDVEVGRRRGALPRVQRRRRRWRPRPWSYPAKRYAGLCWLWKLGWALGCSVDWCWAAVAHPVSPFSLLFSFLFSCISIWIQIWIHILTLFYFAGVLIMLIHWIWSAMTISSFS